MAYLVLYLPGGELRGVGFPFVHAQDTFLMLRFGHLREFYLLLQNIGQILPKGIVTEADGCTQMLTDVLMIDAYECMPVHQLLMFT